MVFDRALRLSLAAVALATCSSTACMAQTSAPLLNPLFQDHAVLQRDAPVSVWGTATPGETIHLSIAGQTIEAKADAAGDWSAKLPAMAPGGPYTLEARSAGGAVQTASDVLVGDVFLCSGQSNMEWPVSRALDADVEMRNASNERIRMLSVQKASSAAPQDTFSHPVAWEVASPETVGEWSAVCYFFARELQQRVDVPIGLIHSSWGGSDIRAWMSDESLSSVGGHEAPLSLLRQYSGDEGAAQRGFGERWEQWWRTRTDDAPGAEPWQPGTGAAWPLAPEGLGDWQKWEVEGMQGFTGMVWYRTTFTLDRAQAGQNAVLSLGGIDEVDQTWINGRVVGNTFGWGTERNYRIPAALLQEGENTVVVNVLNTYGQGGMVGDPDRRALVLENGDWVPLDTWRYQPVPRQVGGPPRAPWESVAGLTTIYNSMIAPLGNYGLKGVLWYQGESNTGQGREYLPLLQALMAQWRDQFGADLPVLIVQLANYGPLPTGPTESGWAEVREAQRIAAQADPNAGFVVTIDIGDPADIHPTNKQEVGRRLARAARHVIYGEAIAPSGPVPARAAREGDAITVTFEDVDGALTTNRDAAPLAFELCGAGPGTCRPAGARIDGTRVILRADAGGDFTRVRYCWADSPVCTLYDGSGLPATPFELNILDGESR